MKKKSQIWGVDLIVAVILFSIGIIGFFVYVLNYPGEAEENLSNLFYDGNIIASGILSEGYPLNWNLENVVKPGILTGNKINDTKLELFFNLSMANYTRTKSLFNTKYDFFFFLPENFVLSLGEVRGIGKPGTDPQSINSKNLVKITRFTIYKHKPVTAYIYIWEE